LEAVRKYGKRFHHISTDEVFGAHKLNSKISSTPKLDINQTHLFFKGRLKII
jgi:dTDP-D-glucose 4,6-dehydratase